MVPVVDNSSFSSSDMDNVTLDARSESCDAVSFTENTAEYEQRVFKGKNRNVVMESGIELRQAAGFGDDERCLCLTSKICLIIWSIVSIISAICVSIALYCSNVGAKYSFGYLFWGIFIAVFTMISVLIRNGCMMIVSIVMQVFFLFTVGAVAIVTAIIAVVITTPNGQEGLKWLCAGAVDENGLDAEQKCFNQVMGFFWFACISSLLSLTGLVFLIVLTCKGRRNAN